MRCIRPNWCKWPSTQAPTARLVRSRNAKLSNAARRRYAQSMLQTAAVLAGTLLGGFLLMARSARLIFWRANLRTAES